MYVVCSCWPKQTPQRTGIPQPQCPRETNSQKSSASHQSVRDALFTWCMHMGQSVQHVQWCCHTSSQQQHACSLCCHPPDVALRFFSNNWYCTCNGLCHAFPLIRVRPCFRPPLLKTGQKWQIPSTWYSILGHVNCALTYLILHQWLPTEREYQVPCMPSTYFTNEWYYSFIMWHYWRRPAQFTMDIQLPTDGIMLTVINS